MKDPFQHIDKVLEHRVRLQIVSVLMANDVYDFNGLKVLLGVTDGNLATHMRALEKERYVAVSKSFINRRPNTRYRVSEKGRQAFRRHIDALEAVIKQQKH